MKLFECQRCGQLLYFENTRCERCGSVLGFLPEQTLLSAMAPQGDDDWSPLAEPDRLSRFCANARHDACNWLLPAGSAEVFCQSCRLNHMIPNLSIAQNLVHWRALESAERRLVYGLLRLGLPIPGRQQDPSGLAFDFLADATIGPWSPATPTA